LLTLAGAYLRLVRAFERIADLTDEIYREGSNLTAAADETGHFADLDAVAPMITVIASETVHNLRGSLDHLVYQLAALDSGSHQPAARFPICETLEQFRADATVALHGLNAAHIERLDAVQPYRGVQWPRKLVELTDPARQSTLVLVTPESDARAPFYASTESTRILAFADGSPVVTSLGDLAREVSQLLESFNPDFA